MRIDAHQHFWDPAHGDYGWLQPGLGALHRAFGPSDLRPELDRAGIDATILVQAAPAAAETARLLTIAAATPWVAGVVGWVDLDDPGADGAVDALADEPLAAGIRPMLQDLAPRDWILAPGRLAALERVAARSLTFDALIRDDQIDVIADLASRLPDLRVVLDHAAKPRIAGDRPDDTWTRAIRHVATQPSVFCKLSGLVTEASGPVDAEGLRPWFDVLLEAFGVDRLLWGSDWPVLGMAGVSYMQWCVMVRELIVPLGDAASEAIMGGNVTRAYRLERTG